MVVALKLVPTELIKKIILTKHSSIDCPFREGPGPSYKEQYPVGPELKMPKDGKNPSKSKLMQTAPDKRRLVSITLSVRNCPSMPVSSFWIYINRSHW